MGDIAAKLAQQIRQNGSTALRTDYNLSDGDFYEIAIEVSELLDTEELYGFNWLGLIWMST